MQIKIIRVEKQVVSCELEDGHILDIDRRWLGDDIKEGDILDFNVEKAKQR